MEDFFDNINSNMYDIHKLSSERSKKLSKFLKHDENQGDSTVIELNFSLANTFWGNSWYCSEKLKVRKGKEFRANINVNTGHSLSEIWDCRVIYYNSVNDHNIYLKSFDNDIIIQIYNNIFTCTCDQSHELSGFVSEQVAVGS